MLGERLGAEEAGALEAGRAEGAEEDEAPDAGLLGRPQQPVGAERGHLLDPPRRLVADRRRQVDHGVGAADRVAQAPRVAEVGERELHADPLGPEPPRIADQAADLVARVEQHRQQRRAHHPRPSGEQDHRASP